MSVPDGHLIRTAFLTKYGYSPDLTYDEILCEFQKRYDQAQGKRKLPVNAKFGNSKSSA